MSMERSEPDQLWWTAEELAASGLPLMPGTKRAVNFIADRDGWRRMPGGARRKPGRGGGWQYHWSVLPMEAQIKLLSSAPSVEVARADRGTVWAAFDGLKGPAKAEARKRLEAVDLVEALHAAGSTHVGAVDVAARKAGVSARTVYNWLGMIEGVAAADRLAYLAPRHGLVRKTVSRGSDVRAFMRWLQGLYLRLEGPAFTDCYRDTVKKARKEGWSTLAAKTARRQIDRDVPRVSQVFAREGLSGLWRCYPAQQRDRSSMHAMEAVNADCHKIDVFVRWPDGTVNRPQIVAFQDIYSGKILSWRVDHDPNKVAVMSAFGELIETWGIPKRCLFDNGREFANKWMTGGAPTRFRFKVVEDEPLGVLPLLGIQITWATPAHGQAKPIERAFRDLASSLAKDIRFAGAYVGNRPDAKPENYNDRAVPADEFLAVTAERIDEHNARQGRLSPTAMGRSFDQTFAESYAEAAIAKATEEQRRLWLMGQHVTKLNRDNGSVKFQNNIYHSDWMSQHPSREVVARFIPDDLHEGLWIYDKEGSFLGFAECQQKVGFFDLVGARELARRKSRIKSAEKQLAKARDDAPVEEIAADMRARAPEAPAEAFAKVVAPVFGTRRGSMPRRGSYQPTENAELDAAQEAMILKMTPAAAAPAPANVMGDTPAARFRWAQSVLERSEAGKPIGSEEAVRLQQYCKSVEYLSQLEMFERWGADGIG